MDLVLLGFFPLRFFTVVALVKIQPNNMSLAKTERCCNPYRGQTTHLWTKLLPVWLVRSILIIGGRF